MVFPTSSTWDLLYFDEDTVGDLLSHIPADITVTPALSPYFAYSNAHKALMGVSIDGSEANLDFNISLGSVFTWEVDIAVPNLPKTLVMNGGAKLGIGFSNGAGSGAAVAFSELGIGFGPDNQSETLTPLPDTVGISKAIRNTYYTIRVALDAAKGRAYVYINPVWQTPTTPQFVLPVPVSSGINNFELFVQGASTDAAAFMLKGIRASSGLEITQLSPRANPGPDRILSVGQTVRFDGRASSDPEKDDLTYRWSLRSAPIGSQYAHAGTASTVDDGDSDGVTTILATDPLSLPDWLQAGDTFVLGNSPPILVDSFDNYMGSLTVVSDSVPDSLTGAYYQLFRQSFFLDSTGSTAVGLPDVSGIYRVELVVNDGYQDSPPVEVIANVVGARAPFGAEPQVEPIWQAIGDEWALLEGREFFTETWRGVAQMLGARLLEAWQYHYNYSVLDVQETFQRKWLAYRTFTAETFPDEVRIDLKYGRIEGSVDISGGAAGLTGTTLVLEHYPVGIAGLPVETTITFSGDTVTALLADINTPLSLLGGVAALDASGAHLVLTSTTFGFTLGAGSTALELLGLTAGDINVIQGAQGGYISDFVYKVDDGINLGDYAITENDLLSISGVGYRIIRVISDVNDSGVNQRLLLRDEIPIAVGGVWEVPSLLRSSSIDFSLDAAFPGDLLKFEAYDESSESTVFLTGTVVSFFGGSCGAHLHELAGSGGPSSSSLEFLGIKRRKALVLPDGVVGVPQLQDIIPVKQSPQTWIENLHYVIEPIYRDESGGAIPVLQFRNDVFITPDIEPPDVFWAEYTYFDNNDNIEGRFGRLSGLSRDALATVVDNDSIPYKSAVSGLLYSQQRGPLLETIRVGAQVLFGQPFAEVDGVVTDIQSQYSQSRGRIIVSDAADSEVSRTYHYRRDENNLLPTSGLDMNPRTGAYWAVGDTIFQFEPIGAGVTITDYVSDPTWFVPRTIGGFSELRKIHTYAIEAQTSLVSFAQLDTLVQFLDRVSPSHKDFVISAVDSHTDDAPITDDREGTIHFKKYSCPVHTNRFMLDHYRGDGTAWVDEDDGPLLDEYLDSVVDLLSANLTVVWAGGAFTEAAFFPTGYSSPADDGANGFDLVDVNGGGTVIPTYNAALSAGTYTTRIDIKTAGLVIP